MKVRREVLVFVVLGALAWFAGLNAGVVTQSFNAHPKQVREYEPPAKFDIRRAG